ncbi:MAG: allantoin permease, partial [Actinomycetales bacterium]
GWPALGSLIVGAIIGWGLVTPDGNTSVLAWQGYVFDLLGVEQQSIWRGADIGVIVALFIGFAGTWIFGARRIARQEVSR